MTVGKERAAPPDLLSIGELAQRTGVARTALRYYDELGLVRPAARASGRRRYPESAINAVIVIRFLGEVGFSLAEINALLRADGRRQRNQIITRKVAQIAEQQHKLDVARAALEHGLRCPANEPAQCPRFLSIVEDHRNGLSLEASHNRAHAAPQASPPA